MKKKKYLPLYYKWMESGWLPQNGLCMSLDWPDDLDILKPPGASTYVYWANEGVCYDSSVSKLFNPIRQNIVLFLAAMNNEL